MSGRGRGGRGRGRGGYSKEMLNALGVQGNEAPEMITQPPPPYPPLEAKALPLAESTKRDYRVMLKEKLLDFWQLSPSYVRIPVKSQNPLDKEIDQLAAQLPSTKEKYDWNLFPIQLRPKLLAKRVKTEKKDVDIKQKLEQLEQIETTETVTPKEEPDDENVEEEEELEVDEIDDDMEDGTDYANNYFDNGEINEDEDDNFDDGAFY